MRFHRGDASDALSLRTLDAEDTDVFFTTDDRVPETQNPEVAKKEIPQSPLASSYNSSPPLSASQWTLDTSEFSEDAPLLGTETPPPRYQSALPSPIDFSLGQRGQLYLRDDPPTEDNVRDIKRERRKGCLLAAHIGLLVFLTAAAVFFLSFRAHRNIKHGDAETLPKWAYDCPRKDKHVNYVEFDRVQDLELFDGPQDSFSGTLKILSALPEQAADVVIMTRYKTKGLHIKVNRDSAQELSSTLGPRKAELETRSPARQQRRRKQCTSADVTLHFREGLVLDNLHIGTSAGLIQVYSGLNVVNSTVISTKAGRIQSHRFMNTRKTYINSGSSSLQGHFKLYDVLSITSTSGSIDVTVDAQEVDHAHPKPAELMISSQSGSIRLNTGIDLPSREYITSVESNNGMIQGKLIHGSKTLITSQSGMIQLDIVPFVDKNSPSSILDVRSASGMQKVRVQSPPSGKLTEMRSSHTSRSGSLGLSYPQEWEGMISGQTGSGSIEVTGHGVHVIESRDHRVKAEKDDGNSFISFKGESGSARLDFGF